jgi:TonB family protein
MDAANKPITATTSLSVMLHCIAIAAAALVYEQVAVTGSGIEIQLISSTQVADQRETEAPHKSSSAATDNDTESSEPANSASIAEPVKQNDGQPLKPAEAIASSTSVNSDLAMPDAEQSSSNRQDGNSTAQVARSTNALHQKHSMIELLHARISEAKEYPYIARRQRREGVATVSFVLHPDGSIENTHLVASSSARSLDRAALSAVHRIEPFKPAKTYLDRPEAFKVDVVFNLL